LALSYVISFFFLFPVPFLLTFAIEHGGDLTAWVAYAAVVRPSYWQRSQQDGSRAEGTARRQAGRFRIQNSRIADAETGADD
jgi:hypothetical protein